LAAATFFTRSHRVSSRPAALRQHRRCVTPARSSRSTRTAPSPSSRTVWTSRPRWSSSGTPRTSSPSWERSGRSTASRVGPRACRVEQPAGLTLERRRRKCLCIWIAHYVEGATRSAVAHAHQLDLAVQDKYQVQFLTYWFDEPRCTAFCLIVSPDKETVQKAHNEAHGLVPNEIIEVNPGIVQAFLGRVSDPPPADTSPE